VHEQGQPRELPGNSSMLQLDNTQFLNYPPEITTEQFFVR
jgi:hypothetical protein